MMDQEVAVDTDVEAKEPSYIAAKARAAFEQRSPEHMKLVDRAIENARYLKRHGRWPSDKEIMDGRVLRLPVMVRGR